MTLTTILHISYATTWGGGEQQMMDLIHALNELETKNPLICFKDSELHKYVVKNHLNHIVIENKKLKILKEIIKNSNADVLHIHTGSFIKDYILLNLFYNISIPCVYTINGIMRKKSFFSKLKYNYSKIHAIHFVSNAANRHFKEEVAFKSSYSKLYTIYDGIQIDKKVTPVDKALINKITNCKNPFIIGNIANHTRAKNLMSYLRVADYLVNNLKMSHFHFVQIGRKTKLSKELEDFIESKDLNNNVHFLGFIEDAESYLSLFDVLLISSNREGLPLVIMEAFKYYVPVVSTNAGGIPEALINGENGFLSEVDDAISLGNNIIELYKDKNLIDKFTTNAHQLLVDRFSFKRMGEETLELYKKLIS